MAASGLANQTCCDHRSCFRRHKSLPILSASRLAVLYQLLAIAAFATSSIISSCKHSVIPSSTKGEQGKFPLFNPSKTKSLSTPPAKPSSAARLSNSSFINNSKNPTEVVTPDSISAKAMQPQWGLAAHTELNSLTFVPIASVPAVTPNQSPISGNGPTVDYPPSNSGFPTDRRPTMPSLKNPVATTPPKERKRGILSGSLPDKYIQALRLAFSNSGHLHAIDNYGHLILNPDSGVNFVSGSAEMTKSSQQMAQKLVRLYAETLMVELKDEAHTIHIAIKGYTNPRPESNNTLTHNANRRISLKRAAMIRNILSDSKIWQNFNLSIDGRGEDDPIARADNQVGPCGIYDCERSRRIELEATIK